MNSKIKCQVSHDGISHVRTATRAYTFAVVYQPIEATIDGDSMYIFRVWKGGKERTNPRFAYSFHMTEASAHGRAKKEIATAARWAKPGYGIKSAVVIPVQVAAAVTA